jgi:predicted HTH domain antitoxin
MPLLMTDEQLAAAGLTEAEAKLELACRLFDAGKISFPAATHLAGVSRTELETALHARGLPSVRMELKDFEAELNEFERRQRS